MDNTIRIARLKLLYLAAKITSHLLKRMTKEGKICQQGTRKGTYYEKSL